MTETQTDPGSNNNEVRFKNHREGTKGHSILIFLVPIFSILVGAFKTDLILLGNDLDNAKNDPFCHIISQKHSQDVVKSVFFKTRYGLWVAKLLNLYV